MGKYRKTQQQLEDAERRADKAESNITIVRHNILPRNSALRSVSVSREVSKNLRIWESVPSYRQISFEGCQTRDLLFSRKNSR